MPAMPKAIAIVLVLLPGSAVPSLAQTFDRALLSTFCDAGNIKGSTCTRAKGYPNAPKRGCDVTLTDRYGGRFIAAGNPLLVVNYDSGCEAHATDDGGSVVFEQVGSKYVFRGFQPGERVNDCITTAKDAQQDVMACLTGHMGQGILESGVALMNFAVGAGGGIRVSTEMLLRAEDSTGAYGANTVTCKEHPPKYFELSKLAAGPRPMTVSVDASFADAETVRIACGKGFAKPAEAVTDLVPGDAWMPDDRMKRGTVVIDLVTRKIAHQ